jgi:hypothetical protein
MAEIGSVIPFAPLGLEARRSRPVTLRQPGLFEEEVKGGIEAGEGVALAVARALQRGSPAAGVAIADTPHAKQVRDIVRQVFGHGPTPVPGVTLDIPTVAEEYQEIIKRKATRAVLVSRIYQETDVPGKPQGASIKKLSKGG